MLATTPNVLRDRPSHHALCPEESRSAASQHASDVGSLFSNSGAAQEGVIALWKGWLPSVIGVVPYVGLNFAVYETLKDVVLKFYGDQLLLLQVLCLSCLVFTGATG